MNDISIKGMAALRRLLFSMRWDDQGGYCGYMGDGKWSFVTTGLPQITPEDLNSLFEFAGIVPDVIISLGSCTDCAFSINGQERGYKLPCFYCKRPSHSHFEPKDHV